MMTRGELTTRIACYQIISGHAKEVPPPGEKKQKKYADLISYYKDKKGKTGISEEVDG